MTPRTLIQLSRELRLTIGASAVDLTPREGLRFAERLIRASTRRMVEEEITVPPRYGSTNVRSIR
jgi:hypothetical protein